MGLASGMVLSVDTNNPTAISTFLQAKGPTGVVNKQVNGFAINKDGIVYSCTNGIAIALYNGTTCNDIDYWNDISSLNPWTAKSSACAAAGTMADGAFVLGGTVLSKGNAVNFDPYISNGTWTTYTSGGNGIGIGDIAFDGNGFAYMTSLYTVYKSTAPGSSILIAVGSISQCGKVGLTGIALDDKGYIYYACGTSVYRAAMNSPLKATLFATAQSNVGDIASCAYPTAFTG
jgi:hypothetical protein